LIAAAGPRLARPADARSERSLEQRSRRIVLSFVFTYRGVSILPGKYEAWGGWKSPTECQLLPANIEFATTGRQIHRARKAARAYLDSQLRVALLFPEMKVVAPRLVTHYFANAGNPEEGSLRNQAAAFLARNNSAVPIELRRWN